MNTLVWVEHDNASVKDATLSAVTAAAKLGEVHLLVAGAGIGGVAEAAAKVAGVAKVVTFDDAAFKHALPENVAPAVADLMRGYDAFVAPSTSNGKNIAPRVAALLDVMQVSDILSVESADTFTRPIYAGNAIATVQSSDAKKVITVRGTAFEKAAREGGSASIEAATGTDAGLSSFVGAEIAQSERPELTSAKIIVSGGRALGSAGQFHGVIDPLADKLGAGVGASRAAVDAGYAPNDFQVGQTGKIVAPEVYVAVGISGAIQHLAGMKDSKTIIAINKDEDAPIFQVADIGDLEDGCVLILVDRDDGLAILHASKVLNRTRYADGDIDFRRHDLAGLADLKIVGRIASIDRCAACAHTRAQLVGQRIDHAMKLPGRAQRSPARDDDFGRGEFRALGLGDLGTHEAGKSRIRARRSLDTGRATLAGRLLEGCATHRDNLLCIRRLDRRDRISRVDGTRERVSAFHRQDVADLHHIKQGRHARRDVLAIRSGRRHERVIAAHQVRDGRRDILGQSVFERRIVERYDFGDTRDLRSSLGHAADARTGNQQMDLTKFGSGGDGR